MNEALVGSLFYDISVDGSKAIREVRAVDTQASKLEATFTAVTSAIKLYAAALAVVKATGVADEMRQLAARVQVAAGSIENGTAALGALQRIAARTQTDLAATAGVFNRLNQSISQMGGNQNDTLQITELLGKAIKVSGASGTEAASAMTQFGQALGSGKLAGDELRSLLENAPYLMQQLAKGIGVPVGALKQMGEDGKLTADVVTEALRKAAGDIDADFKKLPQTFEAAFGAAGDQAKRATEALDNLTGGSTALTGVTRGLGDAIGMLADQLTGATTEADKLGRSKTIDTWAENTTLALSYVVDAGEFVVRGFRQIGLVIYETAMSAKAAATGGFQEAGERLAGLKQQLLEIGGAQYAGAKIRQRIEALATGDDGSNPMDRRAASAGAGSKLKGGKDKLKDKPKAKFDQAAYLADLAAETADGLEKVAAVERKELAKNQALLEQGKISRKTFAEAVTLIEANATKDRQDIQRAAGEARRKQIEDDGAKELALAKRQEEERKRGQAFADDAIAARDPVAALQLELQRKLEANAAFAALDAENQQRYADAAVALAATTADKLAAIRQREVDQQAENSVRSVALAGDMAGQLYRLLESSGRERTALGKTLFLASKALAVAEILLNTEVAASKAGAQLGIYGIPMATLIRAQGYASAAIVGGMALGQVAGGRQYGGPVSADSLYRVNEGGRPEMFTAANGAQFLMPTADGRVTPAGGGSGGQAPTIIIQNMGTPQRVESQSYERDSNTMQLVTADIADQISSHRGPVWQALRGSTNVTARL